MTISATLLWLIAAVVLGILEMMASTFYLLVLAAAACVGSALAFFEVSVAWQIAGFAIIAVAGSVWVSRIRRIPTQSDAQAAALQNIDQGQIVDVAAWRDGARTTVQYRGAQWDAIAKDASQLNIGAHRIVEIQGSLLVLEKI